MKTLTSKLMVYHSSTKISNGVTLKLTSVNTIGEIPSSLLMKSLLIVPILLPSIWFKESTKIHVMKLGELVISISSLLMLTETVSDSDLIIN